MATCALGLRAGAPCGCKPAACCCRCSRPAWICLSSLCPKAALRSFSSCSSWDDNCCAARLAVPLCRGCIPGERPPPELAWLAERLSRPRKRWLFPTIFPRRPSVGAPVRRPGGAPRATRPPPRSCAALLAGLVWLLRLPARSEEPRLNRWASPARWAAAAACANCLPGAPRAKPLARRFPPRAQQVSRKQGLEEPPTGPQGRETNRQGETQCPRNCRSLRVRRLPETIRAPCVAVESTSLARARSGQGVPPPGAGPPASPTYS